MVEIYCGDGKGKTTAAAGLALRAQGHGIPVIFAQFLKEDGSGEIAGLRSLTGVAVLHARVFHGFVKHMSEAQRREARAAYDALLCEVVCMTEQMEKQDGTEYCQGRHIADISVLVVLDEVLHACNFGLLDEERLLAFISSQPPEVEIVLTGRNPSEVLRERADYISVIEKDRHPFDLGVGARVGVEL